MRIFHALWGIRWFWLVLSIPAIMMLWGYARGEVLAMDLLHPTGETSVRLMVLAMLVGPLSRIIRPGRILRWWMARRRTLGVAAFAYALLHLVFYAIDMETIPAMIDELPLPGIWTGWVALLAMLLPALASNDAAMRALRRGWKRVQRFAYPAAFFTLIHWGLLYYNWLPGLIHFGPLAMVHIVAFFRSRQPRKAFA